jgi:hypothetical protein
MAKVNYQGREVDATIVDFLIAKEDWNEYHLHDGAVLRLRVVLSEVYRVTGEYDSAGVPIYVTKSGNVVTVRAPDALMKSP